ncbi:CAMK/CAMKL/PASK protein kinase [Cladophialophora yegresii CBS 114405]|uniref:non-specific serine/threonine protein kinase n=1 Tax=Cladophialophora yegresii CBS 114405 TaxID=1182544 RepID=W9WFB0_9EURO|nr:CAMK/CAMKL/PASK protein kinase [Cladophialophora yegresii CBS 114405]EXJ63680.1 CAMK/CAMKL/PASK protein kinase [Cladophialophora yegresii CBS 114405]
MSGDQTIRIPKNKSTGNLAQPSRHEGSPLSQRTRFSFDAGTAQEMSNLKRAARLDHDGLGRSGLRRIRRQGPPLRTPTLILEGGEFVAPSLYHSKTMPISGSSSRSVSTGGYLISGPSSPAIEDLHRFPSESLHSFSFAKQSEQILHVRQNILQKSIDFVRGRSSWAANPALVDAQARVSGDPELQGMMDLLKKANIIPIDTSVAGYRTVGTGPLTGPAHVDGRNVFEKSFSVELDNATAQLRSFTGYESEQRRKYSLEDDEEIAREADLEMRIPPTRSESIDAQEQAQRHVAPRAGLKRTYTDVHSASLQQKLIEALAQPYSADDPLVVPDVVPTSVATKVPMTPVTGNASVVHSHSSKWSPTHQAVFRTQADAPWTILAANDIACLIFGVTRAEVRSLSILGVIQEERRQWLETRLARPQEDVGEHPRPPSKNEVRSPSLSLVGSRSGITARLLSKAPSRANKPSERAKTDDGSGSHYSPKPKNHPSTKSRGVLLCGDIVPIQRRDGTRGAASFWVMEKRGGLIWVIEEITEDVAYLDIDDGGEVKSAHGGIDAIWGRSNLEGSSLKSLLPKFPLEALDSHDKHYIGYFAAETAEHVHVPTTVEVSPTGDQIRVSSLPHIAGVMVLDPQSLKVTSSNSIFSAALFGYQKLEGLPIANLIPSFEDVLTILRDDDNVDLVDGIVVPEHSFRRARTILSLREGKENPAHIFLRPCGVPAKHRDGSDIMVDIQMRVIRSETVFPVSDEAIIEERDESQAGSNLAVAELVYALWIIYSRNIHGAGLGSIEGEHAHDRPMSPPSQPEPPPSLPSPPPLPSDQPANGSQLSLPAEQSDDALDSVIMDEPLEHPPPHLTYIPHKKKTIEDFTVLEEMGSGAYGQVKLVRYKKGHSRKMVLKYVTKKRILVDTWTRDRKLGTVPLEIHVLDFLRRDGLRHPNIVEMIDFFEDDVNYYIEMLPHGIPGMDLFDYIELRTNMTEAESRNIFRQVVDAIHHLHTKAFVVHRDIKDENVVLDGEGRIKLIDFGSAAYIKNGPFDVFVGTIDYAAPEVLQGRPYGGKEQDVWALGILLYTIAYKENPFYNLDEILDHPLRVPFLPFSEECLELIRKMLDRDLHTRYTIEEVVDDPWLQDDDGD